MLQLCLVALVSTPRMAMSWERAELLLQAPWFTDPRAGAISLEHSLQMSGSRQSLITAVLINTLFVTVTVDVQNSTCESAQCNQVIPQWGAARLECHGVPRKAWQVQKIKKKKERRTKEGGREKSEIVSKVSFKPGQEGATSGGRNAQALSLELHWFCLSWALLSLRSTSCCTSVPCAAGCTKIHRKHPKSMQGGEMSSRLLPDWRTVAGFCCCCSKEKGTLEY